MVEQDREMERLRKQVEDEYQRAQEERRVREEDTRKRREEAARREEERTRRDEEWRSEALQLQEFRAPLGVLLRATATSQCFSWWPVCVPGRGSGSLWRRRRKDSDCARPLWRTSPRLTCGRPSRSSDAATRSSGARRRLHGQSANALRPNGWRQSARHSCGGSERRSWPGKSERPRSESGSGRLRWRWVPDNQGLLLHCAPRVHPRVVVVYRSASGNGWLNCRCVSFQLTGASVLLRDSCVFWFWQRQKEDEERRRRLEEDAMREAQRQKELREQQLALELELARKRAATEAAEAERRRVEEERAERLRPRPVDTLTRVQHSLRRPTSRYATRSVGSAEPSGFVARRVTGSGGDVAAEARVAGGELKWTRLPMEVQCRGERGRRADRFSFPLCMQSLEREQRAWRMHAEAGVREFLRSSVSASVASLANAATGHVGRGGRASLVDDFEDACVVLRCHCCCPCLPYLTDMSCPRRRRPSSSSSSAAGSDESDLEFLMSMHYGNVAPEKVTEIKLNVENISSMAHGFSR